MRHLTDFSDQTHATGFHLYLNQNQIDAEVREDLPLWQIWILDDENYHRAGDLLKTFGEKKSDILKSLPKTLPPAKAPVKARVAPRVNPVFGEEERKATYLLILISVAAYIGQEGGLPSSVMQMLPFARPGSSLFQDIFRGEVWRLLTPIFLHGNLLHIVFNMMWLYQLGSMVETLGGTRKLLLLVAVSGILSNSLQYTITGRADFGGMSGVIYALLCYAWGKGEWQPSSNYFVEKGIFGFMMVWFALCFTGLFGPIANYAHLGGLVVGLTWARLETRKRRY